MRAPRLPPRPDGRVAFPAAPRVLYIPEAESPAHVLARIERACDAALGPEVAILVRAYAWPTRELLAVLTSARGLTHRAGARLFVSGRVDLGLSAVLDGVHLATHGMSVDDARTLLTDRPSMIVGASCHDAAEIARAGAAAYLTLSPVGLVPGKGPALGLEGFRALAARSVPPVLALGGIAPGDVRPLVEAGAFGIAVRRSVDASPDPSRTLQQLLGGIRADLPP